jgi:hypothetical protein
MNLSLSPTEIKIITVGGYLFWTLVYLLVIRRSIKDRTCGFPMVALCADVAWEFVATFVYPFPRAAAIGNGIWLCLDVGILCTLLRYGPNTLRKDISPRWFYPTVLLVLALSFWMQSGFVMGMNDRFCMVSSAINGLMVAAMFVGMILRRGDVLGQSFYIALLMLLGDLCGYVMIASAAKELNPPSAMTFLHPVWVSVLCANVIYCVLVWRMTKAVGFNPWRRW